MIKRYTDSNVYDNLQKRLKFIFEEFENIYVSFSGGKDSTLLLNLVLDFKRKYYPNKKIGVYHQDFEAQYSVTTKFIEDTFEKIKDEVEPYWLCLPAATRTALSNYQMYWYPWDDQKEDVWVREMPKYEYVINLKNNFITTYKYKMPQEQMAKQFGRWYRQVHGDGSTICLLGIRADESLQRYNGFLNKKYSYKNQCWISKQFKNVWSASPLYDWTISDVWHANFKFKYDYNPLYDMFYMAGVNVSQMRVASPFNDSAKESLNLYRILDSEIWVKLLGRVKGVNFTNIYAKTKAMGYRNITLPEGYTWKEYTKFLLATLPVNIRNNYVKKFNTSIKFWHKTGGGLEEKTIQELINNGYKIQRNGISNYTTGKNSKIIFLDAIPDDTDDIKTTKDIPSWKRMCFCILKNDHICRFMGFNISTKQKQQINLIKNQYKSLEEFKYGK